MTPSELKQRLFAACTMTTLIFSVASSQSLAQDTGQC